MYIGCFAMIDCLTDRMNWSTLLLSDGDPSEKTRGAQIGSPQNDDDLSLPMYRSVLCLMRCRRIMRRSLFPRRLRASRSSCNRSVRDSLRTVFSSALKGGEGRLLVTD